MRAQDNDPDWIRTQLTLARWYLDAAASSAAEEVRHRLQQAREVCAATKQALSGLKLSEEQHACVARELSVLHSRLEAAWSRL